MFITMFFRTIELWKTGATQQIFFRRIVDDVNFRFTSGKKNLWPQNGEHFENVKILGTAWILYEKIVPIKLCLKNIFHGYDAIDYVTR